MKKHFFVVFFLLLATFSFGQSISERLQKAFQNFENDSQLKHALNSLYVIEASTGKVVFDKNSQIGLAGASTQKIITAATAFELLGKDFRYQTKFGYDGSIKGKRLYGSVFVFPSGDPTFGSWRYANTKEIEVTNRIIKALKNLKVDTADYLMLAKTEKFEVNAIPDRWIWQDIGNYYGAGSAALNWRENQFDILLNAGNEIGDRVEIAGFEPYFYAKYELVSNLAAGPKGSGDNAYIFLPAGAGKSYINGTIPVGQKNFKITGAVPDPVTEFQDRFIDLADKNGIGIMYDANDPDNGPHDFSAITEKTVKIFHTENSPALDSIVYWFLKKSINLYGEALVKTFALEKNGFGSTDSGLSIIKKFWKEKGLDEDELNIYDGSGLSPMNRITTHAQVGILKYAKSKDWFSYFYDALPEYNGMKMKSGTIGDVKGFCGYQRSKDGKEYIFSFLVNNYSGKTSSVVAKMYKVLDELK